MKSTTLFYGIMPAIAAAAGNPKRGLCFVPNSDFPEDNQVWTQDGSDLTWYYNYGSLPSPAFADKSQDEFEFIPMMWGVDLADLRSTKFLDDVNDLIQDGRNISRVMGFNEPDTTNAVGGSDIPPANAAEAWVANFIPLQEKGIQVGLPAMTGAPSGLVWLHEFLGNCSELISTGNDQKNCTFDFLPVHWYDNFEGLASHIGERLSFWPNTSIWVTEYAFAHQDLPTTTSFFNTTLEWFDGYESLGGYSYFGAFRSAKSNVGANAPFLNNAGELTDIGSWYLGFGATGVEPQSAAPSLARTPAVAVSAIGVVAALVLSVF